jgi:hypothetical protein
MHKKIPAIWLAGIFCNRSILSDQRSGQGNTCHPDGDHAHQFDEDVKRRAGFILERVTNRKIIILAIGIF